MTDRRSIFSLLEAGRAVFLRGCPGAGPFPQLVPMFPKAVMSTVLPISGYQKRSVPSLFLPSIVGVPCARVSPLSPPPLLSKAIPLRHIKRSATPATNLASLLRSSFDLIELAVPKRSHYDGGTAPFTRGAGPPPYAPLAGAILFNPPNLGGSLF